MQWYRKRKKVSFSKVNSGSEATLLLLSLHFFAAARQRTSEMGFDLTRFQGEVDEELICPICSGVLEEPLQVKSSLHFPGLLWLIMITKASRINPEVLWITSNENVYSYFGIRYVLRCEIILVNFEAGKWWKKGRDLMGMFWFLSGWSLRTCLLQSLHHRVALETAHVPRRSECNHNSQFTFGSAYPQESSLEVGHTTSLSYYQNPLEIMQFPK